MMHVVVRLPWKRPKEELKWTLEKDNILWTFLAMSQSSNLNWETISQRVSMPPDECVKRASYLYQQQLHFLQQRHNTLPKQPVSPSEPFRADPPNVRSSRGSPSTSSPTLSSSLSSSSPSSSSHSYLSQARSQSKLDAPIDIDALRECVKKFDFEWAAVGREMGANPMDCRKLYFASLEDNPSKSSITGSPSNFPSPRNVLTASTYGSPVPPLSSTPPRISLAQGVVSPVIAPTSAGSSFTAVTRIPPLESTGQQALTHSHILPHFDSIPAFLPDEVNLPSGSDSGEFGENDELFSDSSVTQSALESAYFSDPKIIE